MSKVIKMPNSSVSAPAMNDLREMETTIVDAIEKAKESGVPQGLVVAILHGHATRQTLEMVQ